MLVYDVAVTYIAIYPPRGSSQGEEDYGCGPAQAAAVRD